MSDDPTIETDKEENALTIETSLGETTLDGIPLDETHTDETPVISEEMLGKKKRKRRGKKRNRKKKNIKVPDPCNEIIINLGTDNINTKTNTSNTNIYSEDADITNTGNVNTGNKKVDRAYIDNTNIDYTGNGITNTDYENINIAYTENVNDNNAITDMTNTAYAKADSGNIDSTLVNNANADITNRKIAITDTANIDNVTNNTAKTNYTGTNNTNTVDANMESSVSDYTNTDNQNTDTTTSNTNAETANIDNVNNYTEYTGCTGTNNPNNVDANMESSNTDYTTESTDITTNNVNANTANIDNVNNNTAYPDCTNTNNPNHVDANMESSNSNYINTDHKNTDIMSTASINSSISNIDSVNTDNVNIVLIINEKMNAYKVKEDSTNTDSATVKTDYANIDNVNDINENNDITSTDSTNIVNATIDSCNTDYTNTNNENNVIVSTPYINTGISNIDNLINNHKTDNVYTNKVNKIITSTAIANIGNAHIDNAEIANMSIDSAPLTQKNTSLNPIIEHDSKDIAITAGTPISESHLNEILLGESSMDETFEIFEEMPCRKKKKRRGKKRKSKKKNKKIRDPCNDNIIDSGTDIVNTDSITKTYNADITNTGNVNTENDNIRAYINNGNTDFTDTNITNTDNTKIESAYINNAITDISINANIDNVNINTNTGNTSTDNTNTDSENNVIMTKTDSDTGILNIDNLIINKKTYNVNKMNTNTDSINIAHIDYVETANNMRIDSASLTQEYPYIQRQNAPISKQNILVQNKKVQSCEQRKNAFIPRQISPGQKQNDFSPRKNVTEPKENISQPKHNAPLSELLTTLKEITSKSKTPVTVSNKPSLLKASKEVQKLIQFQQHLRKGNEWIASFPKNLSELTVSDWNSTPERKAMSPSPGPSGLQNRTPSTPHIHENFKTLKRFSDSFENQDSCNQNKKKNMDPKSQEFQLQSKNPTVQSFNEQRPNSLNNSPKEVAELSDDAFFITHADISIPTIGQNNIIVRNSTPERKAMAPPPGPSGLQNKTATTPHNNKNDKNLKPVWNSVEKLEKREVFLQNRSKKMRNRYRNTQSKNLKWQAKNLVPICNQQIPNSLNDSPKEVAELSDDAFFNTQAGISIPTIGQNNMICLKKKNMDPKSQDFQLQSKNPTVQSFNEQRPNSLNNSPKEVAELSDDAFCITQTDFSIPTIGQNNIINPFTNKFKQQQSFQTKLEEKYARKLQTRNIVELGLSGNSDDQSIFKEPSNPLTPGEVRKRANQEIREGLSSDTPCKGDNVGLKMNFKMNSYNDDLERLWAPAGIPKSFLANQDRVGAIQPQRDLTNNPRNDLQSPMYQNVPRLQSQMFAETANANVGQGQAYSPTEVYDNVKHNEERLRAPAGIPKSFLANQDRAGAIQPQRDLTNNPRNDLQSPMYQNVPVLQSQIFVETANANVGQGQAYSPTEVYDNVKHNEDEREDSESPDMLESGQKRQSAFERLGPLAQPKKPKLTINLSMSSDQAVREVVEVKTVYEDENIINSTDETVIKYLPLWPWKIHVYTKKSVTARSSKTVMMMEQEQMEEIYEKERAYIMITVKGYPPSWTKEQLLDMMLENLAGKSFIPCFIEFKPEVCRFLVIRCRGALVMIHWLGFTMRKEDVEIQITISTTTTNISRVDFVPRAVLKKRLAMNYDGERNLDLSEFTLKHDISNFIYFPLNRISNQDEILRIESNVVWEYLTELNLSRNRITSLEGFKLETKTPKLNTLDLSHNYLDSIKPLIQLRQLALKRLTIEGNPLCTDYTDPDRYVKVMRILFPTLRELDGIPIVLKGEMPPIQKNYCPENAKAIVEKFLEVYFPLLDQPQEERNNLHSMYSKKAVMTVTYRNRVRYDQKFKNARNLVIKSRVLLDGDYDMVYGAANIVKLLTKWPNLQHDPSTFTVDVMFHDESSTIVRINGILKLTAESLAEDETILAFTRTLHLFTKNGSEYKIINEMLYWDEPTKDCSNRAFQQLSVPKKSVFDIKFESTPDDNTKKRLVELFMKLTELEKSPSERCLEANDWHMKHALEYFLKLLKLDNLQLILND